MKAYEQRVQEGQKRNAAWRELTSRQKLDSLDKRLGRGQGAARQRKVLYALLFPTEPEVVLVRQPVSKAEARRQKA